MAGVRIEIRNLLEHLAIVTIFSNGGLPVPLVKVLMDVDPTSELPIADILGDGPARLLITRGGGVRFMHQIIAEKVLTHFQGGAPDEWRLDLKPYSISFIRDTVAAAGPEAMRTLFRQMFVDRMWSADGAEDRQDFAPIIEELDSLDPSLGHAVLEYLAQESPEVSHFWSHLGRHQVYRVDRDYEKAEEYLERAIALDQDDPLHHHTFGLVLRSRLRQTLKSLSRDSDIASIFSALNPLFDRAAAEFEQTRLLSADDVYGYITHIQMIVSAAQRLKLSVKEDTIARVGLDDGPIGNWLTENLSLAEQLLRDATQLYGTLDTSNQYLLACEADLDQLYGDLDSVVEIWELATASVASGARSRRALANAYFVRNKRRWAGLQLPELRRIVQLMEENLREGDRRDDDYRLWFNAYILLPEFDADEALAQLALWAKRFPSWRSYYYSYVLHFMLWFARRTDDTSKYEQALENCTRRHVGRKNASALWCGGSQDGSGLVSEDDLGGWSNEKNFFKSPGSLRPVNGIVDRVNGPQAGTILIGGKVRAFFVPGKTFSAHRNENTRVHFFLGFSPGGLRAWSVKAGHVANADRAKPTQIEPGSVTIEVEETPAPANLKTERARKLREVRALRFVRELARAKARIGASITVEELENRLDALMKASGAAELLGIKDLAAVVTAGGDFEVRGRGKARKLQPKNPPPEIVADVQPQGVPRSYGKIVMFDAQKNFGFVETPDGESYWFNRELVHPNHRKACTAAGPLVTFSPSKNEKGGVARGIIGLDVKVLTPLGPLAEDRLEVAVTDYLLATVANSRVDGVALDRLRTELETHFRTVTPLLQSLGAKNIRDLVNHIDGLAVRGGGAGARAVLSNEPILGRLPLPPRINPQSGPRTKAASDKSSGPAATDPARKSKPANSRHEAKPPQTPNKRAVSTKASASAKRQGPVSVTASAKAPTTSVNRKDRRKALADAMRVAGQDKSSIDQSLIDVLREDILDKVRLAETRGRPLDQANMGSYLRARFPGPTLPHVRLSYARLGKFLQTIGGLTIGPEPKFELRTEPKSLDKNATSAAARQGRRSKPAKHRDK